MKKCELLVPAGGTEQFIAAVENGADAIYIGGKLFNARINAGNFDDKELVEAVDFAHKRGVKVHVAMNILLTDEEIAEALEYVKFLYEKGVDALIIQDWGLALEVLKNFPDMQIHLSTQGSVYDLEGVRAAEKLGFKRVVLARELSFDEIKYICDNSNEEIEIFVHGALCICYSGQCQMSRYIGGRSGNRGQCAQPCRLSYKTINENEKLVDTFKYPLSPKDICQINNLGKFIDAGVSSFKIEGRMKSPEYVAIVTSIYRKYIDEYYKKGFYVVSKEDEESLKQIFNRGGFTEGYFDENPEKELMSGNIPKHQGIKIGKVLKSVKGTTLVDVKLYGELSIGDGIEIQGKNIVGNVVTYLKPLKGGLTRIGDIKGAVSHGDPLYRISSKSQLNKARGTFFGKTYESGKYIRKTSVNVKASLDEEGVLDISFSCDLTPEAVKVSAGPFEKALENPTEVERIKESIGKMGNTPFSLGDFDFIGKNDRKIKISAVNKARREGVKRLEENLMIRRTHAELPEVSLKTVFDNAAEEQTILEIFCYSWQSYKGFSLPCDLRIENIKIRYVLPVVELVQHEEQECFDAEIIPYISNISKGLEDQWINENFDKVIYLAKKKGIYVGNLSWIERLNNEGVDVYADFGLNVYNEFSEKALNKLGIKSCSRSIESYDKGFGALPLMISEHSPEGDIFIDRKKERYDILKKDYSNQTIILSQRKNIDCEKINQAISRGVRIVRIFATKSGF